MMSTNSIQRTVTATGIGRVEAVPDVLLLDFAVENQAETASATLTENNKLVMDVLSTLKSHGVQEKDIQTTQLSINPVFQRQETNDTSPPKIAGYQVRNGLSVRLRDLQGAGMIIDATVEAGGDAVRVDSISFSFANPSELLIEARKRAVGDAKARAQQLADDLGVALGDVISASESNSANRPAFRQFAQAESATSILPGESEVALQVTVDFEIAT